MSWHCADGLSLTSHVFLAEDSASRTCDKTLRQKKTLFIKLHLEH